MWLKNRTKLFRKRAVHRSKIFFGYWMRKRAEKEPVFVLATRRTGSNMFLSCLNSIPQASFAGEILNKSMYYGLRARFISKKSVLRHIAYSIQNCEQRLCGAKFVKTQLDSHGLGPSQLKGLFPNARFIILYRRSLLEQFVSLKVAEATDVWQWTPEFRAPDSLLISQQEFKEYCRRIKAFYEGLFRDGSLRGRSLVLNYEDLVEDVQGVFKESVFPFLGRPSTTVHSQMVKQNTKGLREIIRNYGEMEPFLRHSSAIQTYSPGGRAPQTLQRVTHVA